MGTTLLFCLICLMAAACLGYLAYAAWTTRAKASKEFEIEFLWKLFTFGTSAGAPIIFFLAYMAKTGTIGVFAPGTFLLGSALAFASFAAETLICRREYLTCIQGAKYSSSFRWRQISLIAISGIGFFLLALVVLMLATLWVPDGSAEPERAYLSLLLYYSGSYFALAINKKLYATKERDEDANRSTRILFSR